MRAILWCGVIAAACSGGGTKTPTAPKKPLTAKEIVQQSSPAIVFVEVVGEGNTRGSGTGFILDKSGLIATNFHVVAGSKAIKVKLYGGDVYQVMQIAGIDPARDLAVLRIQPTKALPTVRLGDSDAMAAGDQVVTIGNPLGVFDYSVSSGLLSQVRPLCTVDMVAYAKANPTKLEELVRKSQTQKLSEQELNEAQKLLCKQELTFFQISAPISKGSSGGPLFNQAGEVIGVTTAIIADGQNINFAVPGNYLKPIMTRPGAISMDEFAAKTREEPPADDVKVARSIPQHAITTFDGCKGEQIVELENAIWSAIGVGAPLYNKGEIEACYRIYEGTATKYETNPPCKGIKQAFGDGLVRSAALEYKGNDAKDRAKAYKLMAWAMRDTFDGLLDAAKRWRAANPGKWKASDLKSP
jgi:serine protease Do